MPFLTISTLLLLASVFTGGCLVTWWIQDRRFQRERDDLEDSMTRALEARYLVYQDLENSLLGITKQFDLLERQWQDRMEQTQIMFASSLTGGEASGGRPESFERGDAPMSRGEDPQGWDLEKEYERRQADQLTEISEKSQRVVELMEKLEALEPTVNELADRDVQFVQMEEMHNELADTLRVRVAELQDQARAGEALEKELEGLRDVLATRDEQVAEWQGKYCDTLRQLEDAEQRTEEVGAGHSERVATLEEELKERLAQVEELQSNLDSVEREMTALSALMTEGEQAVRTRDEQIAELEQQVTSLNESVCSGEEAQHSQEESMRELRTNMDALSEELASAREQVSAQEAQLQTREDQLEELRQNFESLDQESASLKEMVSGNETALAERQQRIDELESSMATVQAEADSMRKRLAQHEEDLVNRAGMLERLETTIASLEKEIVSKNASLARSEEEASEGAQRIEGLQSELHETKEELNRVLEEVQAKGQDLEELRTEWEHANEQLDSQRSALAERDQHLNAAHMMLSELKPLLEQLESNLDAEDEPAGALPVKPEAEEPVSKEEFDLSALDEDGKFE